MAKAISKMTKAELYAEVQSSRGNAGSKSAKKVWMNDAGVKCGSEFTLNISNAKINRHLTDVCGCDQGKGFRCAAVKWTKSPFTYANKGIGLAKARKADLIT